MHLPFLGNWPGVSGIPRNSRQSLGRVYKPPPLPIPPHHFFTPLPLLHSSPPLSRESSRESTSSSLNLRSSQHPPTPMVSWLHAITPNAHFYLTRPSRPPKCIAHFGQPRPRPRRVFDTSQVADLLSSLLRLLLDLRSSSSSLPRRYQVLVNGHLISGNATQS